MALDHDRLLHDRLHGCGQGSGHDVVDATGRKRVDDGDGMRGKSRLREQRCGRKRNRGGPDDEMTPRDFAPPCGIAATMMLTTEQAARQVSDAISAPARRRTTGSEQKPCQCDELLSFGAAAGSGFFSGPKAPPARSAAQPGPGL